MMTEDEKKAAAEQKQREMEEMMRQAQEMVSRAEQEKHGEAIGMAAVYEYAEERFEVELDAVDRKLEKYRNE